MDVLIHCEHMMEDCIWQDAAPEDQEELEPVHHG
jgi:hypothetical protein